MSNSDNEEFVSLYNIFKYLCCIYSGLGPLPTQNRGSFSSHDSGEHEHEATEDDYTKTIKCQLEFYFFPGPCCDDYQN